MSVSSEDVLAAYQKRHDEVVLPIARRIMDSDPTVPFITAFVMAQDEASMEFARAEVARVGWLTACQLVGSFSRMAFVLELLDNGRHVTRHQVYEHLPALWRGSDPDDKDPRFLALWTDAWEANGRTTIRDGHDLPHGPVVRVWRGQDDGDRPGIAWTTDVRVAERFARGAATRQSDRNGAIYTGTIMRRHVLAYLTGRGESEVIVDPASVR